MVHSTFIGGASSEQVTAIDTDSSGNIYVVGKTASLNFPTTAGVIQPNGTGNDSFITKFNPSLSSLIYSTYFGNGTTAIFDIKVNSANEVFVSGFTSNANFPATNDALQRTINGINDSFVAKVNSTATSLIYSSFFGGRFDDTILSSHLSSCGELYVAGVTRSDDLTVRRAYQPTNRDDPYSFYNEGFVTKFSFLSTAGAAPDATADGSLPTTVSEYKLPPAVDTEVLDLPYRGQPLQVELWANIYHPTTLTGNYPVLIFLHGMHDTCERKSILEPPPPPNIELPELSNWYAYTGICDNPDTAFNEAQYYDEIKNHSGYEYLGQKLASLGYIVVSINVNRGIHGDKAADKILDYPDKSLILPRARMVLRHLQKLHEWNACTTDPACQSLPNDRAGVDLRGKLDFSNVGFLGHSRGGQGVRAAHNLYKQTGSVWEGRIPNLNVKAMFEIAPTDAFTEQGIIPQPESRFVAEGVKWNVLLPMCDSDVFGLDGVKVFDRMLLRLSDNLATQKSTYTVWGANHNFYNTKWTYHDNQLDRIRDYRCVDNDPLFERLATGSEKQKQTGISSVLAFFRANVGNSTNSSFNQNFNSRYDLPGNVQAITRIERGFTPSPSTNFTKVFDDFLIPSNNTYDIGDPAKVSYELAKIDRHDQDLNVARVTWTASGNDKYFQTNWESSSGTNISAYQTLDFRISRFDDVVLNSQGSTNFSIQLEMANGTLSSKVKLCNYLYLDGPVGGYDLDPVYNSSGILTGYRIVGRPRAVLQTVRIPLTDFMGVNLSQIRAIRFTFDETQTGKVHLANIRLSK